MAANFLTLWVGDMHYIRSILLGGPIGINAVLKSGDELLEVSLGSIKDF